MHIFKSKCKNMRVSDHFVNSGRKKMHAAKKMRVSDHFVNSGRKKMHAAGARSAFASQHVKKADGLGPFLRSSDVEK